MKKDQKGEFMEEEIQIIRLFQCYRMFYQEIPNYETREGYLETANKMRIMMTFLSEFGYGWSYGQGFATHQWYEPNKFSYEHEFMISTQLERPIVLLYERFRNYSEESLENQYQESIKTKPLYDCEVTSMIGKVIDEYSETRNMNKIDVLRQMSNILNIRHSLIKKFNPSNESYLEKLQSELRERQKKYPIQNFEDMILFLRENFKVFLDYQNMYSINDPMFLEYVKKMLKKSPQDKRKIKHSKI